jgi:hypothetical protein
MNRKIRKHMTETGNSEPEENQTLAIFRGRDMLDIITQMYNTFAPKILTREISYEKPIHLVCGCKIRAPRLDSLLNQKLGNSTFGYL